MDHVSRETERTVEVVEGVFLTLLAVGDRMSVQHLRMAPGSEIPTHDHHHEQVGFVYQGTETFVFEDGSEVAVDPGESYRLESDEAHGVLNRGDGDLLAIDVFSPPRPDPDWASE
jgi:mannose-6-phosphate isomerase-like protein (cupin superfamily)